MTHGGHMNIWLCSEASERHTEVETSAGIVQEGFLHRTTGNPRKLNNSATWKLPD